MIGTSNQQTENGMNKQLARTTQATTCVPADPKKVAKSILDTLGYEAITIKREAFNDDDYYVYNPLTLQLDRQYGSKQRHMLTNVPNGMSIERGITAKWIGLWKLVEVAQ